MTEFGHSGAGSPDRRNTSGDNGKLLYCSFCGKSQNEVRKLIAGPSVFICDECVDLCNDIIREEIQEANNEGEDAKLPIPEEINEILNQYVIGQQKAKRVLAVAVYNHYKRLRNSAPTARGSEDGTEQVQYSVGWAYRFWQPCWQRRWPDCWTCCSRLQMLPPSQKLAMSVKTQNTYSKTAVEMRLRRRQSVNGIVYIDETTRYRELKPFNHPRRVRRGCSAGTAQVD